MMERMYKILASARLTICLFLLLATTSVVGTLVQQGLPRKRYVDLYGPDLTSILSWLDAFDMYHSWWFTGLLLLLAVNVITCTARRIPRIVRRIRSPLQNGDDRIFRSASVQRIIRSTVSTDELETKTRTLMHSLAGEPSITVREGKRYLAAQRGRYARLGTVAVHVSILFILAGGLIGAIWGFAGQMMITEGTKTNTVALYDGGTKTIPFAIGCDDFSVSFYENGMPKEYRSDVTVLEGEKKVLSAAIKVNEPLRYRGVKFCQATYGIAEAHDFKVAVRDIATGQEKPLTLALMKKAPLPNGEASFAAARFAPDFQGRGPALLGVLLKPGQPHDIFWLFRGESAEHGGYIFSFHDFTARFYTGIQVGSDPGVPLVWAGFILLLLGLTVSLFGTHRRLWVRITPTAEGTEIAVAADPGNNNQGFEKRLDEACRTIFTG